MRKNWKSVLLLIAIGWFIGAGSGFWMARYSQSAGRCQRHFKPMRDRFIKKLGLTPEQKTQVEAILRDSRRQVDQILSKDRPKLQALRNAARSEIRRLLTPEQQVKFDRLEAKRKARIGRHFQESELRRGDAGETRMTSKD